ncbi:hypothetical protein J2Y58_004113 [Sphingomonas sp. BE138]|uniref:hypothetical protein n=1 Tax=Sphingomonas sp. BE138 TaxID=2817845 RepID=UPI0028621B97|nr:hypothetical protein [Sphingomonas sp. BE138]MDR6790730.1 hypothetical protein [Sphingomonas sp. BE138]
MTKASTAYVAWMKAGMDMCMLGAEAGTVMALRIARIAAGGSAGAAEAELMVTEKVCAAIELQTRLMTGALGVTPLGATQGTLKHYRRKVSANNRRLSRPRKGS